jgi:hypothetical protein
MKVCKGITLSCRISQMMFFVCAALLFAGCGGGGGGGSGGSSSSGTLPGGGGIVLMSITFPEWTDLSGATTAPEPGRPLGQQVVFTFSGIPDCVENLVISEPPGYSALQIYAPFESDYYGPEAVVDLDRNTIPARGTYERFDNKIVFTPFFPTEEIDLSPTADLNAVPGLLPDMEYTVYVPLTSSIVNLVAIDKSVANPIEFTTISADFPTLFFKNHPAVAPAVVAHYPADGDVDVPLCTIGDDLPGLPAHQEFFVEFDQPLLYDNANVKGEWLDVNNDGVDDENMFFLYPFPEYYAALDFGTTSDPGIYSVDIATGKETLIAATHLGVPPYTQIGLNSIAVNGAGEMFGSSLTELYYVEYRHREYPAFCRLTKIKTYESRDKIRGLSLLPNGDLVALDSETGTLLQVGIDPGPDKILHELGIADGTWMDLAVRLDGMIYAVAVDNTGLPVTTLKSIDLKNLEVVTLFSGAGDYTSISMTGWSRLALYSREGPGVDLFDLDTLQILPAEHYDFTGGLENGAFFDIAYSVAMLGTYATLETNTYHGSKVILRPSGILPFGERVDFMVRLGLSNISLASRASEENRDPAEAERVASFTTFDYAAVIDDLLLEEFVDREREGRPVDENPSLPAANWAVQDVDGQVPEYEHLLATYGLGGGGNLGDFSPLGVYPTVILDTDYQAFPLFDGSTPDVKKQVVVTGGVFNFEDIDIPEGVTVVGMGSNPLILKATGSVRIAGCIDISGARGMNDVTFNSAFTPVPGGIGGAGGGRGGVSHPAVPVNFRLLTDLRSPKEAEHGWGPSNIRQSGGRGAVSGANGTDTKYNGGGGGASDISRGSGGGGGSYFKPGGMGYHGRGGWGADPNLLARYVKRLDWVFNDGAPVDMPGYVAGEHTYATDDNPGGLAGDQVFSDADEENNFIGYGGEVTSLQGGQGGGGGGTRLDSMNPNTIGLAASWNPPVDRSAYDAKGGGAGGGGGAVGIYSLGSIIVEATGQILARGGDGGGGEVIGHSNFGGAGGGGSGGAIILDSATTIEIKAGAAVDVSGGWPGDGKENSKYTTSELIGNTCLNPLGNGDFRNDHKATYCAYGYGDGGFGGCGLIQFQVADWQTNLIVDDWESMFADECIVNWMDAADGKCDFALSQTHCGCGSTGNCAQKFWHYKINYPSTNHPEFPRLVPDPGTNEWGPMVNPTKTPTNLGPFSYGLSKWVDMGQTIHRSDVSGDPAPRFLGFRGIDAQGVVVTLNGYIPNPDPQLIDITVNAPDWNNGMPNYIPETNEVIVLFQGADALVPGSKVPDPDSVTDWTGDINTLSGKQFVRFRVSLNTAKDTPLKPTSPKPQVNFVRLRMQY